MKFKIIIIIIIGTILTSIIYVYTSKDNLNILALGDGLSTGMTPYHVEGFDYNDYLIEYLNESKKLDKYYKNFNEVDETVSNLINKINNNIENIDKKIKLKQAIKNADIITLSLGMDELNNYAKKNLLGSTKINGYLQKYDEALKIIRSLNNKKIYLISLYSTNLIPENKINKINEELKKLCQKYNINYIDISNIIDNQDFFIKNNNYYINYKGQEYIFNKIKDTLEISTFTNFTII